jgi:hypothetical protein
MRRLSEGVSEPAEKYRSHEDLRDGLDDRLLLVKMARISAELSLFQQPVGAH